MIVLYDYSSIFFKGTPLEKYIKKKKWVEIRVAE